MLKIGVDAMGGDFAPEAAVKGAVMAVDAIGDECRIVLFGDEDRIRAVLKAENCAADRFDIVHTTEVIEMGDHPAKAFQQKTNSSIVVGFSTVAPTVTGGKVLLLDVGLNVDCKPEVLAQYGIIGSIYAQAMLGIRNPRVAVLNIGEEETKGNAQSKAAYELMKESEEFNFVGNVEGSHLFSGQVADVIVCDGFVGNTLLKTVEGLFRINKALKIPETPFWRDMNYEYVGGTPVLGVNAPVVIGHGCSSALAIKNMILTTERCAQTGVTAKLQNAFKN